MLVKRLILGLLTVLAVINLLASLQASLGQPQIQSRLELYQTNLILQALEFKSDRLVDGEEDNSNLTTSLKTVVGENPYQDAEKQYQKARQEAKTSLTNLQTQLKQLTSSQSDRAIAVTNESNPVAQPFSSQPNRVEWFSRIFQRRRSSFSDRDNSDRANNTINEQKQQLAKTSNEIEHFIDELDIKRGILIAHQQKSEQAKEIWQKVTNKADKPNTIASDSQVAKILLDLWSKSPQLSVNSETTIQSSLDGWFRYRVLTQLYQQQDRENQLAALQAKEQEIAWNSLVKLFFIAVIPLVGGAIGVVLAIFIVAQRSLAREKSLLATNGKLAWQTPWDWETTWQVIIVGFFFLGQIVLPLVFGISGFNPASLSLRYKAVYVLVSYLAMASGGILVLYFSLKPYFPLPKEWFRIQWFGNWSLWGIGGYTIAIPLVVIVSLLNQQLWNGQGGSNPLLYLALQSQDRVALAIFFITASIAAPIFEEIMFRGFLLPSLTRYVSVTNAIILSGFIFAIAHLSLSEVLPLMTLGIILGIVYTRSRNLLSSILLHSLWNSGTLLSLFVLGS